MRSPLACIVLLCTAAFAACDRGGKPPSPSPPPSDGGQSVTGRERIGWTQAALSLSDAAVFQFAAYVDGARRILEGVTCAAGNGDSLECSSPLPALTPGRHTIEIATFITSGSDVIESARSLPLQLNVVAVTARQPGENATTVRLTASDGTGLDAEVLATDLADPVDVTVDPAGRILVAERGGKVRFFETATAAGGEQTDLLPEPREGPLEIRSLALAPDFEKSRHLYVLGTQARGHVTRLLVTRYREVEGRLGEAAVLLAQDVSAADVHGVVRFGEAGTIYVAIAQTESSRGRIMRLPADGSPLRDDASGLATTLGATRGLAWDPALLHMWTVGRRGNDDEIAVLSAGDRSSTSAQVADASSDAGRVTLPEGTIPSGIAVVRSRQSALDGDLIVSSIAMADLLRFRSAAGPLAGDTPPARLLQGRFGAVGGVAAAPDGSLYFFTANAPVWGAAGDLLVRVAPAR